MAELETTQGKNQLGAPPAPKKRKGKAGRVCGLIGIAILILIVVVLLVNALLNIFVPHYYPTFGKYRLFAVVTDSMDPVIPRGHMIVDKRPESADDVTVGSVITFEVTDRDGNVTMVLTHRVKAINTSSDGVVYYVTRGDNADGDDQYHATYEDVVGIYSGKHCAFFGYFFGFLQSENGTVALIFMLFILIIAWIVINYINSNERRKKRDTAALQKSAHALSDVNLRYDNIREITAVMDVLDMVTEEPKNRAESREIERRLNEFILAETIELPQTPETAAILDSLPAPDTPMTLAAALRAGATLRQAEDGQTLILTGMSGGKSILLTPIQTPEGIILCQQGVRLRADIAPNIETVGTTSMPQFPEFFEGQPIKKNVEYPELPEPNAAAFGAEMLSPHNNVIVPTGVNALPTGGDKAEIPAIAPAAHELAGSPEAKADNDGAQAEQAATKHKHTAKHQSAVDDENYKARLAYAQYREAAAALELMQTEELTNLLNDVSPLSQDEQAQIKQYRKANKKKRAPKTPEQLAAQRQRAEQRKAEQEAFLNALTPADRELYLSEQKLAKSRAATIRRLKRINADRKILNKLNPQPEDK